MYFCGIDWSESTNALAIVDPAGALVEDTTITHSAQDFQRLLIVLETLPVPRDQILIGIETPHHALVDWLLDREYSVYALPPKVVDRARDRYRSSRAWTDAHDAYVIADLLRTDHHRFRPLAPGSDLARKIGFLSQARQQTRDRNSQVTQQLRSALQRYYPTLLAYWRDLDRPSVVTLLEQYPTGAALQQADADEILATLKAHGVHQPRFHEKVLALRKTPPVPVHPVVREVGVQHVQGLVAELRVLRQQLTAYTQALEDCLAQHPDTAIFASLPMTGTILTAGLLGHFGDNRERFPTVGEVRAHAGTAPVTQQSGGACRVCFRFACDTSFRDCLHQLAFVSLRQADWAQAYYADHRDQGKNHPHALRCLAKVWLKIIHAMWRDHTRYDPERLQADRHRNQAA